MGVLQHFQQSSVMS